MRPGTRVLVVEDDDYTAGLMKLQIELLLSDGECQLFWAGDLEGHWQ